VLYINLEGIITALVTPFDEKGYINEELLRSLCEYQASKQVNGILVLGTTGEGISLSTDERKLIAEIVVDELKGTLPVIVHVGSSNIKVVTSLAQHAVDTGANAITSITPYFFKMSDRELLDFYVELSKNVPKGYPIFVYNFPEASGNDINPVILGKLLDKVENIVGIKYSSSNMMKTQEYLKLKKNNFKIFTGADQLFYPALCLGCDGLVSGNANVLPELYLAIFRSFKEDNLKVAKKLHYFGSEIAKLFKYGNIPTLKAGMKLRGIDGGYVKKPFKELDINETNKLQVEFSQILVQIRKLLPQI
jgi:4-hydroxy-tetrahydrodipicolinate synthase